MWSNDRAAGPGGEGDEVLAAGQGQVPPDTSEAHWLWRFASATG